MNLVRLRTVSCAALLAAASAACDRNPSSNTPSTDQGKAIQNRTQAAAAKPEPLPDAVRVRLETEAGPIMLELDAKRAPVTTANFVRYVDERRFDGISFYRAAPTKGDPDGGFIQGGIRRNYRLMLPPIAHEPTSQTGLRHEAGTISMARAETGAGAMGDFFILTAAMPAMDASGEKPGYAAFGKVAEGMDVVRKILAAPTVPNAGRGAMRGQMLAQPVRIVSVRRLD
jgi:peptidyl-prolyl cis-trans isomerase A (cyclophilin A)